MMTSGVSLSIITVVFNAANNLEDTIVSVLRQSRSCLAELIIIDGGSTDGTVEIINSYKEDLAYWTSEKDSGIYDAMNKGVVQAKGEWILFLNSGDVLTDNALKTFMERKEDTQDIVYGDIVVSNGNGLEKISAKKLRFLKFRMPFCHQSAFVKKQLLIEFPFNLEYKLAADYDFFSTAYNTNKNFQYIPFSFAQYDLSGVSIKHYDLMFPEIRRIIFKKNNFYDSWRFYSLYLYYNKVYFIKRLLIITLTESVFLKLKSIFRNGRHV